MARAKITAKAPVEPERNLDFEDEPVRAPVQVQDKEPPPAPLKGSEIARTGLNKSQAIREAIAAGHDKPQDGAAWIKEQYDIQVTPQMFSTVKNGLRKAQGKPAMHVVTRSANTARPALTRPMSSISRPAAGSMMDLARTVRDLVRQHGVDAVRDALELFAD